MWQLLKVIMRTLLTWVIHAVELSQSSSTSSALVLTANEIAANLDNEALNILNKAMEKMLIEKTESFISAQYKELDKIIPSKTDNLREYLFNAWKNQLACFHWWLFCIINLLFNIAAHTKSCNQHCVNIGLPALQSNFDLIVFALLA